MATDTMALVLRLSTVIQLIASSPFLPAQYKVTDPQPNKAYNTFAAVSNCSDSRDVFNCLVSADSQSLQQANYLVAGTGASYGSYVWLPVVDGTLIRERPHLQLMHGHTNGQIAMIGNNANEGELHVVVAMQVWS